MKVVAIVYNFSYLKLPFGRCREMQRVISPEDVEQPSNDKILSCEQQTDSVWPSFPDLKKDEIKKKVQSNYNGHLSVTPST